MPPNEIHHADLTDEIRDFHPLFEAPHLSDGLILRVLSRKLNITVGEIAKIDPDIAAFEGEIAGVDIAAAFNGTDNGKITPPKLFTHVIDSIRIRVNDTGVEEKVDQVGLATQYPGPYTGTIAFPALAVGPGMFHLTDLRKAGFTDHGWDQFDGPMRYHYVPYYSLGADTEEILVTPGVREPVIFDTARELAKRAGLLRLAGALEGQYEGAMNQLISLGITNVAAATNTSSVVNVGS